MATSNSEKTPLLAAEAATGGEGHSQHHRDGANGHVTAAEIDEKALVRKIGTDTSKTKKQVFWCFVGRIKERAQQAAAVLLNGFGRERCSNSTSPGCFFWGGGWLFCII